MNFHLKHLPKSFHGNLPEANFTSMERVGKEHLVEEKDCFRITSTRSTDNSFV